MSAPQAGSGRGSASRASWKGALRGNVLMMGLVSLFTDFSSEMIYPLLPVFLGGLVPIGQVGSYVGLLEGVAEATASLLKLVSGRLSDKLGKRKALVVLGYGLSTVARPVMAAAAVGWHVVALRFADRVGKGVRTSPRDALIGDSVGPEARGLAFGFHRAMDHAGAILGPVVSVVILYFFLGRALWHGSAAAGPAEMSALRWLFLIALIPGLAAVAVLIGKVREIVPPPAAASAGPAAVPDGSRPRLPRKFYAFVAVVTLFALGNSSDLFIVLLGVRWFGLGLMEVIGLWVLLHVSKIIFSIPGGVLSDKLGRRPIIVTGWAVYALVYLGFAAAGATWQFWGLVGAYGFYYGMTEGAEKALVADFVPSRFRGTAYGVYHSAVGLAALPASLLFGAILDLYGRGVAFGIGAALAGLAALGLIVLLSTSGRTRDDQPPG